MYQNTLYSVLFSYYIIVLEADKMIDNLERLKLKLKNIKKDDIFLLLGEAAIIFKSNYSGNIISPIYNEDFSEILDSYDFTVDKLNVLHVCSYSLKNPLLLTLINKLNGPIILLAEDTDIDISLLINIPNIIKFSDNTKCNLLGSKEAQQKWKETDNKSNINKFYSKESPELYYYKNKFKMGKYLDLFATDNVS